MNAKDILSLWNDDISFCSEQCDDTDCPRNCCNIRDKTIPHSYIVGIPEDCPKKEREIEEGKIGYKSPIDIVYGEMNMKVENSIVNAVQNIGINVDKDELLKALKFDRDQYQKGFEDRDKQIVRCKDCKAYMSSYWCPLFGEDQPMDFYCAYGVKNEETD